MKDHSSKHLSRREFVSTSLKGAAMAGMGTGFPFLAGCAAHEEYDTIIFGGMVFDGLGNPGLQADIALKDGRIARIDRRLKKKHARQVIDARGLAVCPGFIDAHTHSDVELLANPKAESSIRQGITTDIGGNCGSSYFPIPDPLSYEWKQQMKDNYDLEMDWEDLNGFFARLEQSGIANNFATLIGHGAVRGKVMGLGRSVAEQQDLEAMTVLVDEAMRSGALGLSTGLEYLPSMYANEEEIIALAKVVAGYGGVYATHMRSEGTKLLEAMDEALEVSRQSGVSLEISHFKVAYPENWHKIDEALARIEQAVDEGLKVTADRYPYIAGSTGLALYFPHWAKAGSKKTCVSRLSDPANTDSLYQYLDRQGERLGSWEKVIISSVATEGNRRYEGMNIVEASRNAEKKVNDFLRELMIQEELRVDMVTFMMDEENLQRILKHPLVMVGSDSSARAPYGPLGEGKPHPRTYGSFPRVLGKYVREEQLFGLPGAIAKMTSMTAQKFGIPGRGQITEDYVADLVVFDPDRVIDRATWSDPHQYPEGIDYVIVSGETVINQGEHTGRLPGKVIRKT